MSSLDTAAAAPPTAVQGGKPARGGRKWVALAVAGVCALAAWGALTAYRNSLPGSQDSVPTARVQRGDVSLSIFARAEVRGGNSQVLTAPMTGAGELHIRELKPNGAPVQPGDVVVQFDTTEQDYALKEAAADLAEAEQHIQQATAQLNADAEEDRYALAKARTDVQLAELDVRKNPLLAAITAKQNDLALSVARDRLAQLEQDSANKKTTDEAGIAMQQASRGKSQAKILTARQNIEGMTLRAERAGYVSLKQNTAVNFVFTGMELPAFQVGDQARPGMAIAEIPDLNHWEIAANIGELDRGHLTVGDAVNINVIALPNRKFRGHVTDIGSTSGMPWDRRFECKVALDGDAPDLRPGMSARVEIATETIKNALWLPAQSLFESDGKMFVYLRSGRTFLHQDVTLIRRNETRVVLTGLQPGQQVALANPIDLAPKIDIAPKKVKAGSGAMEAIQK